MRTGNELSWPGVGVTGALSAIMSQPEPFGAGRPIFSLVSSVVSPAWNRQAVMIPETGIR